MIHHEFAKEYIVFDVNFASYSFELFACDIHVANYDVECTEEHIMTLLFLLDLKKNEDVKLFREIGEASAKLVTKYGGSLSGEHGVGRVRAEFISINLGL